MSETPKMLQQIFVTMLCAEPIFTVTKEFETGQEQCHEHTNLLLELNCPQ